MTDYSTPQITLPLRDYRDLITAEALHGFIMAYAGYNRLSGAELSRLDNAVTLFINEGHCDTGDVSSIPGDFK